LHRPDYVEAMNNLAAMLHGDGDLAGAERYYRSALRLRPNDPESHYNLALLLRACGDQEDAARHMRTALDLAPSRPDFQSILEGGEAPGA
jgi:Flp pilus assembly protein TadD